MGSGDMGSAVAHVLFNAGVSVALADSPQPAHARRGMAFADAVWDGHATLDGVSALRVDGVNSLKQILHGHQRIPITALPLETLRDAVPWDVLVNALRDGLKTQEQL
jgi:xanthine dehydrogenase accessory factor